MTIGRDFLNEDNQEKTAETPMARDFLSEYKAPEESLGHAALASPFRIGEDVYKGLFNFLHNDHQYYQRAKKGIPAAYDAITQNPVNAGKQGLAGFAELGQNLFNFPHDVANYASNRLNLIPKNINQKIQMARMPDSQEQINTTFGSPQNAGEEAVRWGGNNILNVLGTGGIARALNPMKLSSKNIARSILKEGDKQVETHNKLYEKLWKDSDKAGIIDVPVNQDMIQKNIDFIKQYKSPRDYKTLEKFNQNPTLPNAQSAISDVKNMTRALDERSRTNALSGEEKNLHDALSEINNHIEENMFLNSKGVLNKKLANRYKDVTNSYRENVVPYRYNPDIQAFKNKEIIAKQLADRLKIGEFAAKKGSKHPELYRSDALKKALIGIGAGSGMLGAGATMYKYLTGKSE